MLSADTQIPEIAQSWDSSGFTQDMGMCVIPPILTMHLSSNFISSFYNLYLEMMRTINTLLTITNVIRFSSHEAIQKNLIDFGSIFI